MFNFIDQRKNMLQISIVQVHLVLKPFHFNQGKKRFQNSQPMDDVAQRIIAAVHFTTSPPTPTNRDIDIKRQEPLNNA
jgi:hypothetical protein